MSDELDNSLRIYRPDFEFIYDSIPEGKRVLDIGCGDGTLLAKLKTKNIFGLGIEKNEKEIYKCIEKGVMVHHDDIENGLDHLLEKSFDYVILNHSVQETKKPGEIIKRVLQIGKKVIITFPNFGHWEIRLMVLFTGRTPVTKLLPYTWDLTPNLHFLSVKDFESYLKKEKIKVEKSVFFSEFKEISILPNLFCKSALYVLSDT